MSNVPMTFMHFATEADAATGHAMIDAECRKLGITQTLRTRADLSCIPAIAALALDDSGLPLAYENSYHCDHCNQSWTDRWSCAVDDECACCGKDFSPEETTLRIPEPYADLFEMLPEIAW